MRPIYETQEDRSAELSIAKQFIDSFSFHEAIKLPMSYGIDFALKRNNEIESYLEVKDRALKFGFPGGYYISLLKTRSAKLITATTNKRCFLAVRFDDGQIRYVDFKVAFGAPVVMHGRTDRGDYCDVEPCSVIAWESFLLLQDF